MIEGYLVRNFLNFLIFSFFFLDFPWGGGGGVPERGEQEECYVSVPDFCLPVMFPDLLNTSRFFLLFLFLLTKHTGKSGEMLLDKDVPNMQGRLRLAKM